MSKYDFHCIVCGTVIDWNGDVIGSRPECPSCGEVFAYAVLDDVKEVVDHPSDSVVQGAEIKFDDDDLDDSCLIF